jgi:hypothetical protein
VDENGQRLVVRNGHLPEREVISGVGPIPVRQPRVRHRDQGSRVAVVEAVFAAFPDDARTALKARIHKLKEEQRYILDKNELARCASVLLALPKRVSIFFWWLRTANGTFSRNRQSNPT